eukprot:s1898_g5.t1
MTFSGQKSVFAALIDMLPLRGHVKGLDHTGEYCLRSFHECAVNHMGTPPALGAVAAGGVAKSRASK